MATNTGNEGKRGDNMENKGDNEAGNKAGNKASENRQSDTSNRGFASMDPDKQREIASEGGRAAHEKGTAHEFTSEEARRAGSQSHKNGGNRQSAGVREDKQGMNQTPGQGGSGGSGNQQKSGGSGSR